MSTNVSPDTNAPAPLLQPAQRAPGDRRRLFLFGIGASVVVTVQLVVLTLIMSPFGTSGAQLAAADGPPNIIITDDAQAAASSVADAAGVARSTLDASTSAADLAAADNTPAPKGNGVAQLPATSRETLADQILTEQLAAKRNNVERSAARGGVNKAPVDSEPREASAGQRAIASADTPAPAKPAVVADNQIELAKATNEALAEIAPLPAPPHADAAFFPRPQARPAHILAKRTDLRATTHKVRALKSAGPLDPQWLSKQTGAHFTLQLVSVSDAARFKKFARNVPESRYMAHLQVAKSGSVRHVLYRGVYRKRSEAERDANEIARITGVKPWIRRIDAVLKEAARGA